MIDAAIEKGRNLVKYFFGGKGEYMEIIYVIDLYYLRLVYFMTHVDHCAFSYDSITSHHAILRPSLWVKCYPTGLCLLVEMAGTMSI